MVNNNVVGEARRLLVHVASSSPPPPPPRTRSATIIVTILIWSSHSRGVRVRNVRGFDICTRVTSSGHRPLSAIRYHSFGSPNNNNNIITVYTYLSPKPVVVPTVVSRRTAFTVNYSPVLCVILVIIFLFIFFFFYNILF